MNWPDYLQRTRAKNRQERCVLLVEAHWRLTSIAVLTVHAESNQYYTFQRSMQANRNINLWQEKAPIYRLSRSKAPKTQQICHYRHTSKTSELFFLFNTGVDFSLRNNFANSGSSAKVSVPVHNYNFVVALKWVRIYLHLAVCLIAHDWTVLFGFGSRSI